MTQIVFVISIINETYVTHLFTNRQYYGEMPVIYLQYISKNSGSG